MFLIKDFTTNGVIHEGDWVYHPSLEEIGYVIKKEQEYPDIAVLTVVIPIPKRVDHPLELRVYDYRVKPLSVSIKLEDIGAMINLALDTKDTEWLKELLSMKEFIKNGYSRYKVKIEEGN